MLRQVVFHIGQPKTGTSYIQSHLAQNRNKLREFGIYYPVTISSNKKLYKTFESHHLLTYSLAGWEPFNLFSPELFMSDTKSICKKENMHTMLLSAENVYWLPTSVLLTESTSDDEFWDKKESYINSIKKYLKDFDVKIVLYIRRQDQWLESWYNQQIKNGFHVKPDLDEFVNNHRPLLQYDKMADLWSRYFGKDNTIIRVYEKEKLKKGLLHDFCETIGLFHEDDIL